MGRLRHTSSPHLQTHLPFCLQQDPQVSHSDISCNILYKDSSLYLSLRVFVCLLVYQDQVCVTGLVTLPCLAVTDFFVCITRSVGAAVGTGTTHVAASSYPGIMPGFYFPTSTSSISQVPPVPRAPAPVPLVLPSQQTTFLHPQGIHLPLLDSCVFASMDSTNSGTKTVKEIAKKFPK